MQNLIITIIGILLGVLASFTNPFFSIPAGLLAVYGAFLQYKESLPFEIIFQPDRWIKKNDEDFELVIPFVKHKKTNPTVKTYLADETDQNKFDETMCSVSVKENEVLVSACSPFKGKIIII
jgi:hypothetical protein